MPTARTPQADKVRRSWRLAEDAYSTIVANSEESMRYVLNDPYTAEDKENARLNKKPLLKYSIMIPYLAILIGNEQLSRRRSLIKTRSLDPKIIETVDIIQGRWNAINDEQDVEEKIQTTFSDALIMDVGGYMVRSFVMNEEGYLDYHYEVANNMRIKLDPETKADDYMLKKCRWLIKEGWERPEMLMDKFNIAQEDFDEAGKQKWYDRIQAFVKRFKDSSYSASTDYDQENDLFRILEMQERTSHRFVRVYDGNAFITLPRKEYDKLKPQNPNLEFINEFDRDVIHITTIIPKLNDLLVVDEDSKVPTPNFDVFRLGSYSFTNQVIESISLVGLLKDIQDDINKGKSQIRDYLTQILAGGRVIHGSHEKDLFEKMSKAGNQTGQIYLAKNPNTKITELNPQQIQQDLFSNPADSFLHGEKIAQIPAAMQGRTERSGESGKLFQAKVDRAAAAINPYYKNVSNLRKTIAKDFIDNFAYVYSEFDRPVDIKTRDNKGGSLWKQVFINLALASGIVNDVSNASMYVELDEGEDNVTAREENFNQLMALAEVIGSHNPALVDVLTILENAPVKGVDKWREFAQTVLKSQAEQASAQQQIEDEKTRLESAKIANDLSQNKQTQP